jgi:hypothetical protein
VGNDAKRNMGLEFESRRGPCNSCKTDSKYSVSIIVSKYHEKLLAFNILY